MGRYAQARRRGSDRPASPVYPYQPPTGDLWDVTSPLPGVVHVEVTDSDPPGPGFWLAEWRQDAPVVVGPFTMGSYPADAAADIEEDAETDASQYVRVRWCAADGTPLSDWSEERQIIVS